MNNEKFNSVQEEAMKDLYYYIDEDEVRRFIASKVITCTDHELQDLFDECIQEEGDGFCFFKYDINFAPVVDFMESYSLEEAQKALSYGTDIYISESGEGLLYIMQ